MKGFMKTIVLIKVEKCLSDQVIIMIYLINLYI